jgi:hypothetical protein
MLTPIIMRKPHYLALIQCIATPLQSIVDRLILFRLQKRFEMAVSSQIIYLELMLNARFNAESAYPDIYITDNLDADEPMYMGNLGEEQAEVYIGNSWNSITAYATDEEVIYNNQTWISLSDSNTNNVPAVGSSYWTQPSGIEEPVVFTGNHGEYDGGVFFIVNIRADHYTALDTRIAEMNAIIYKYKLFGVNFNYNIYETV